MVYKCKCYKGRFYVSRVVYLMKTAKVNAYIMYIFGKIELLSMQPIIVSNALL